MYMHVNATRPKCKRARVAALIESFHCRNSWKRRPRQPPHRATPSRVSNVRTRFVLLPAACTFVEQFAFPQTDNLNAAIRAGCWQPTRNSMLADIPRRSSGHLQPSFRLRGYHSRRERIRTETRWTAQCPGHRFVGRTAPRQDGRGVSPSF